MQEKIHGSCFQHVIVQGIKKEYIFKNNLFINKYLELIMQKIENFDITILSYCIMNNHAHLLIYCDKLEILSKFMHSLNTSYALFYNKSLDRVGYVFRNRYYSQEILDQTQLFHCIAYIHNNPVKAKIVLKPETYKYSSYNEFLCNKKIITNKSLDLIFGTTTNFKDIFLSIHKNVNNIDFIDIKDKNINDFINDFQIEYNTNINTIKSDKFLMKKFIIQAQNETEITLVELANILGISKSSVSLYSKIKK